jgi:hypothetical protein
MADDARSTATVDDPLAWEAQNARRAGLAAAAAAVLTLVGSIVAGLANAGAPRGEDKVLTLVDTLGDVAAGRPVPPGQLATVYEYQGDHALALIAGALLVGLGTLAIFPALAYLYRAASARGPVPRFALIAAAVGAVGAGIGQAVSQTAFALAARSFANGADHTNSAALDVRSDPIFIAGGFVGEIAGLALAVAFLLICLNAMRAGLLTRFMGVVGMFVGATLVIRQFDPFGVVRSFWLGALALLILGRLPRGRPRAWSVPEAVPWPTQQQVREQREAARRARTGEPERPARGARRRADDADGDGAPPPPRDDRVPAPRAPQPRREDAAPGRPHPSSKKRKRKRRS